MYNTLMGLHITNLFFSYESSDRNPLLSIEELSIDNGESLLVNGYSGCGKTTLLNILAGIILPSEGRIKFEDYEITGMPEHKRRACRMNNMGILYQLPQLIEYLNVKDNILLPVKLMNKSSRELKEATEIALNYLEHLEMTDKISSYPDILSRGEQQRVALCRALISEPRILLCDEPCAGLDAVNRVKVSEMIKDYVETRNAVLVVATHLSNLFEFCRLRLDLGQE